jgi:CheY-like chemotaxis protein
MEKKKVLVVDDDSSIVEILKSGLEALGYSVLTAENEQGVRSVLEHSTPDAIIMDVSMPGTDGISLCREIRCSPDKGDIPVLMLTAFSDEKTFHDAMLFGASGFLTKPFDICEVRNTIEDAIAKAKAKRERQ